MKYEFYKKEIETTKRVYFLVKVEEKYNVLQNIDFTANDFTLAQEIIDGVEASKTMEKEGPYEWGNEDVELNANKNGVWLYDWLADRGGVTDIEKLNLFLTHDVFLNFMKDFKKFIEENK